MGPSPREHWHTSRLRKDLLSWYEANQRDLPWRRNKDPYSIWVSEVMLQQTRVAVVIDRHKQFLERFPSVVSLALAPEHEVLALWSGLGYYRRARMLHKAARFVAENLAGTLPDRAQELLKLPGIGDYTAAAIASIAHGEPIAVVDGNVDRVLCRLAGWESEGRKGAAAHHRKVNELANQLLDPRRPGASNQAVMELGATVCLPRNPQCLICPLAAHCATRGEHKTASRPPMLSREVAYGLCERDGESAREVLLEQRPSTVTVMPGMWELPALRESCVPDEYLRMTVRHAIMQVNYYVRIRDLREHEVPGFSHMAGEQRWFKHHELSSVALTGLARKVLTRAQLLTPSSSRPPEPKAVGALL